MTASSNHTPFAIGACKVGFPKDRPGFCLGPNPEARAGIGENERKEISPLSQWAFTREKARIIFGWLLRPL